jgi:hypothetical protein
VLRGNKMSLKAQVNGVFGGRACKNYKMKVYNYNIPKEGRISPNNLES